MLGEHGDCSLQDWSSAIDWSIDTKWSDQTPSPLFTRLDLSEIIQREENLVDISQDSQEGVEHTVKGSKKIKDGKKMAEGIKYIDFESFMDVELQVGKISAVKDHENADKLYVVSIDDGSDKGRTICAGLKEYYTPEMMVGMSIVFVANLKPRKLRGVMSEGMMLAADDGRGGVKLITVEGEIETGSRVR